MRVNSSFAQRKIRSRSRRASSPETVIADFDDFSGGINSYVANDLVAGNELRYMTDGRIATVGRYTTRKGWEHYSDAAGEAEDQTETSTTGAADQTITKTNRLAIPYTAGATGRLTKVEIRAKDDNSGTAPLRVDIYSDSSSEPGTLLASSSVKDSDIGASYAYEVAYFADAPSQTSGTDYWIVIYQQDNASGDYKVSSTTNSTGTLSSTDSGGSWSAQSFNINFKTYVSTDSATLGAFRAYKDGSGTTLMAHGTTMYTVSDVDGSLTSIKTGLSGSASRYRFVKVNDIVYYVNGNDAVQKWNFTTSSTVSGAPTTPSHIELHKNQLFFVSEDNKLSWSDIADFETFTSTNFDYIPATKYNYPITAIKSVNDMMMIFNEREKFGFFGDDRVNFELAKLPGERGTYSQETMCVTRNFVYFVSEDGIYRTTGSNDELISAKITDIVDSILDKRLTRLYAAGNKVYFFYPSAGATVADTALVYNIDFDSWESTDLNQNVSHAISFNGSNDSGELVFFSNLVGQAFYTERDSANYSDAGRPLTWELRPRYESAGEAFSRKQIVRWYTRYLQLSNSYDVELQYDTNYNDTPTTIKNVSLLGSGALWGDGWEWGDGTVWGASTFIDDRATIPSNAKYIQPRYYRKGVNTPVELIGHTLFVERRRAR